MNYLLDTHILLWWLADDPALSSRVSSFVSDKKNTIFVSAATAWEMIIKKAIGKLVVPYDLKKVLKENDFQELPMTLEHALMIEKLPNHHNDPFDRMLIAQAKCDGLTLITADKKLQLYDIKYIAA